LTPLPAIKKQPAHCWEGWELGVQAGLRKITSPRHRQFFYSLFSGQYRKGRCLDAILINLSQIETFVKARKTQIYLKKHIFAALKKRKKILIAQNLQFVKIL
jgi:hypothetical protein